MTELYAMDLIWLLAKARYDIKAPSPMEIETNRRVADRRSAEEIKNDMLKKARELAGGTV